MIAKLSSKFAPINEIRTQNKKLTAIKKPKELIKDLITNLKYSNKRIENMRPFSRNMLAIIGGLGYLINVESPIV